MLGLQLNQLYNTVNNTGSVVNDLRGYMLGISGDLNDLDQRSRILKGITRFFSKHKLYCFFLGGGHWWLRKVAALLC